MRHCVLGMLCPLLSGCLAVALPIMSATPSITVDCDDVRAFRETYQDGWAGRLGGLTPHDFFHRAKVDEVPVTEAAVHPQFDAHIRYFYLLFPANFGVAWQETTILLYRPGYKTAEVDTQPCWQFLTQDHPVAVAWKEAPDLAAQVEALERVVGVQDDTCPWRTIAPGVLRFAAQEYARLANSSLLAAPEMHAKLLVLARKYEERAPAATPSRAEPQAGGARVE